MKYTIACLCTFVFTTTAQAEPVSTSRTWTESFAIGTETPHLTIRNIWGNVRVRPGPPGQIMMVIDEKRSAPSEALFDRSLETLRLDVEAESSGVSVYVGEQDGNWERRDPCHRCRVDYQFEVTVPPGTQLDVSTVNDGRIDIAGVTGTIIASNVNGPITANDLGNCQDLDSVNGAVEISFAVAPGNDCTIETINGDITISMPDGTGLDVALDVFNGRMTTEFLVDSFELPVHVKKSTNDGGFSYKIQQSAGLRLEGGGPTFSISSLNGDIRFEKN